MKHVWLLIPVLASLAGCMSGLTFAERQYQHDLNECVSIAEASGFTGDVHRRYMITCMNITGAAPSIYASGFAVAPSTPMYGRADAFGPYGVWGPSWQGFNQQFQSQQPATILPPIR